MRRRLLECSARDTTQRDRSLRDLVRVPERLRGHLIEQLVQADEVGSFAVPVRPLRL